MICLARFRSQVDLADAAHGLLELLPGGCLQRPQVSLRGLEVPEEALEGDELLLESRRRGSARDLPSFKVQSTPS